MNYFAKLLSLLFCIFCLIPICVHAQQVRLATGINTDPPFVYGNFDISSEYPGITIEIFKLIEQKTNIKFIITKRPWARVLKDVKSNLLDGGFHFSFKEARKAFVSYPIEKGEDLPNINYSISNRSYVLYKLQDGTIRWNGDKIVHDLNRAVQLTAIRGSSITGDLTKQNYHLIEANTDKQMLKLLLLGRVDGVVGLENMIDAKIETLKSDEQKRIKKTYPVLVNKPYYVAFSRQFYKKYPKIAWKIWHTIQLIKSSGELTEIEKRYAVRY